MEYVRQVVSSQLFLQFINADTQFPFHRLGTSGLYISKIILGTAGFGSSKWQEWVIEEEEALPLLEHAFKSGINTWDTVCFQLRVEFESMN
jgi:hypothetical protein